MNKVYIAVDKDGKEKIFDTEYPRRILPTFYKHCWINDGYFIVLPKGTIRKLIGRDLTWEDEPVELTSEMLRTNTTSDIFRAVRTIDRNPDKSGWHDTDEGNLFYFREQYAWSCNEERISEEFPSIWYEPVELTEDKQEKQTGVCNRCGGELFHDYDMDAYPYGDKIEFDRCVLCGEKNNVKMLKSE